MKERIEKLTLVPRGNTQGTTWMIPSSSPYNSREMFIQQILVALAGRAAEEVIYGTSECTVGAQQDFRQMTRTLRMMIVRYAMARLQELKQEELQISSDKNYALSLPLGNSSHASEYAYNYDN